MQTTSTVYSTISLTSSGHSRTSHADSSSEDRYIILQCILVIFLLHFVIEVASTVPRLNTVMWRQVYLWADTHTNFHHHHHHHHHSQNKIDHGQSCCDVLSY